MPDKPHFEYNKNIAGTQSEACWADAYYQLHREKDSGEAKCSD